MYRRLIRPLLYCFPAELAHSLGLWVLRMVGALPPIRALVAWVVGVRHVGLVVHALGRQFPNPLGVAAGFDKNAVAYHGFFALGFGAVEVGTVTGHAQEGNPKPRLFRLPADQGLLNRMGFNNRGASTVARRIKGRRAGILGVNLGKTKVVPVDAAAEDYVRSARLVAKDADYVVVNVSSPNTPGLRSLQATEQLRPLLRAVRSALDEAAPGRAVPLLVKISPDLSDHDVDAVADLAVEMDLDGIVATNTTVRRAGLRTAEGEVQALGEGGISGPPLRHRSL
ncbi:MAG: quinone-dependent dihydroorotate dehydrogenase, partial [Myxococcales bacterium]|nr:quinone-dependent dihydroorotate dehydrogenase [Myxococcales bacterium]